jgi:hypothetical protein
MLIGVPAQVARGILPPTSAALNQKARSPGPLRKALSALFGSDVCRLLAFRPGRHVEGDTLRFFQRLETAVLNRREMREHVLGASVGGDKAEALGVIEPLNSAFTHFEIPLQC